MPGTFDHSGSLSPRASTRGSGSPVPACRGSCRRLSDPPVKSRAGGRYFGALIALLAGKAGRWAVADHEIYLAGWQEGKGFFKFFGFDKRQATDVLTLSKPPTAPNTLSPDRCWLLYVQTDRMDSDLMLVENFR